MDELEFLDCKYEALVKIIWGMEVVEGELNQVDRVVVVEDQIDPIPIYIHVDSNSDSEVEDLSAWRVSLRTFSMDYTHNYPFSR